MKNILARGGIEFLAVLLGITGSLIIDNRRNEAEMQAQINSSLVALVGELRTNFEDLDGFIQESDNWMPLLDRAIKADSLDYFDEEQLDRIDFYNSVPWGSKLQNVVFNSMESSGLIYNIDDDSLRINILELYGSTYEYYHFIIDYDLTHIQKMDDIQLSSFVLRDDQKSWSWVKDWSNPKNIQQYKGNEVYRNYLIGNRANKRILKFRALRVKEEFEQTISAVETYLAKQ